MQTTTVKTITPEWASEKLAQLDQAIEAGLIRQRPVSEEFVEKLARDIAQGHWVLTHQGIGLSDKDELLLDGQHRLWAIKKAGKAVAMNVTTGMEHSQNGEVGVMDSIDRGRVRSIPHLLDMRGCKNAIKLTATAFSVGRIFSGYARTSLTFAQTLDVLHLFQSNIEELLTAAGSAAKRTPAYLMAPLSVYHKLYPRKGRQLAMDFFYMESLPKGHPALAYHRAAATRMMTGGGREGHFNTVLATCNAIQRYDAGEPMESWRASEEARRWLVSQDKNIQAEMKKILGLNIAAQAAAKVKKK